MSKVIVARKKSESIAIIGISYHLRLFKKGHYYLLHKNYFIRFKEKWNVQYLGQENNHESSQKFYTPILPKKLSRPSPIAGLSIIKNLKLNHSSNEKKTVYFIYEGNFFWFLRMNFFLAGNPNSYAIFNFFTSYPTIDRFNSKLFGFFWIHLYKWIYSQSQGRMKITCDNKKFQNKINKLAPFLLSSLLPLPAPLVPTLVRKKNIPDIEKKTLVVLRGKTPIKILQKIQSMNPDRFHYDLHGLDEDAFKKIGLSDVSMAPTGLNEHEYYENLSKYSKVIFLYDNSDFRYESSGRFMDCLHLGIPTFLPLGTGLITQLGINQSCQGFNLNDLSSVIGAFEDEGGTLSYVTGCEPYDFDSSFGTILEIIQNMDPVCKNNKPRKKSSIFFYNIFLFSTLYSFMSFEGRITYLSLNEYLKRAIKKYFKVDY